MRLFLILLMLCGCAQPAQSAQPMERLRQAVKERTQERFLVRPLHATKCEAFHVLKANKLTKLAHSRWQIVEGSKAVYRESGLFNVANDDVLQAVDIPSTVPPNDPLFAQQWWHAKVESLGAWQTSTANDVVIAVVDTGVNYLHPDLQANLWTGPQGEHGYVCTNGVLQVGGMDDQYHGTMCAGIVGAVGNNGIGVCGVNWSTKIASFKFLSSFGSGSTSDAMIVIDKMIQLKSDGVNIRVANCSWGGQNLSPALGEMFATAEYAGILMVCAAGNFNQDSDVSPLFPAAFTNAGIVSVLASDQYDGKATFSNYGVIASDLFAPGTDILSTTLGTDYTGRNGTSFAAPQVSGAAAMLFGLNPALTPLQVKTILLHPSTFDRLSFQQSSTGGGRLNLRKLWGSPMVTNPPPANIPPTLKLVPSASQFYVLPGQPLNLNAVASDADGSEFFANGTWSSYVWPEPFNLVSPYARPFGTNTFHLVFSPSNLALDQCVKVRFNVSDGHGGGAIATTQVWKARDETAVASVVATNFRAWLENDRLRFRLDTVPDVNYAVAVFPRIALSSACCFTSNQDADGGPSTLPSPGSYTFRAYGVDPRGNPVVSQPSVIQFSGSTNWPPRLVVSVSTPRRGPVPFTVEVSLADTQTNDAVRVYFSDGVQFFSNRTTYRRTFTEPGVYPVEYTAYDPLNNSGDVAVEFFTATPGVVLGMELTNNRATFTATGDTGSYFIESKGTSGQWVTIGQMQHTNTITSTNLLLPKQPWSLFRLKRA